MVRGKGQVLPVALIVGTVLMIFALSMVSMMRQTVKMNVKVQKGMDATLSGDAVVDKSINNLLNGDNWMEPVSKQLPYLTRYRADYVHSDLRNSLYVVQINPGNLVGGPSDPVFERTITADVYTFSEGKVPTPDPTPWTRGGVRPQGALNHRIVQAVVKRAGFGSAMTSGGAAVLKGSNEVYWGDVYCYNTDTSNPSLTLGNKQPLGPGYPAFHTLGYGEAYGDIKLKAGNVIYSNCTDAGAADKKLYPRDPNMPPMPVIDIEGLRQRSKQIYSENGVSSYETGYFYYAYPTTAGEGPNSKSGGAAGTGVERNHQYNDKTSADYLSWKNKIKVVLNRAGINLGKGTGWPGSDDFVVFCDTKDGKPLDATGTNRYNGDGCGGTAKNAVDFGGCYFNGTLVLLGDFCWSAGGGGYPSMYRPDDGWLPAGPYNISGAKDIAVNFNGFLYVGGDVPKMTGNPLIYGSMYINGEVDSTGNFTLYYRDDFNYGMIAPGLVSITKWREIPEFPTPLP